MTGFSSEVTIIIQPKDQFLNFVSNEENSPVKVFKAKNQHKYLVPIDSDVMINFMPVASEGNSTVWDIGQFAIQSKFVNFTD